MVAVFMSDANEYCCLVETDRKVTTEMFMYMFPANF